MTTTRPKCLHKKETIEIESFIFDSGDFIQLIPSGFEGVRLAVFEDPAYNISVQYLNDELYNKLMKGDIFDA